MAIMTNKSMAKGKVFYYGYYRIFKDGTIVRNKRGKGTFIGRELQPYTPTHCQEEYVKLCNGDTIKQFNVAYLLAKHFPC